MALHWFDGATAMPIGRYAPGPESTVFREFHIRDEIRPWLSLGLRPANVMKMARGVRMARWERCDRIEPAEPLGPSDYLQVMELDGDRIRQDLKSSKGAPMSKHLRVTLGLFVLFAASITAQTSADKRTIQVDVSYTGAGTVDAGHKIYVALWDSSDMSGGPPAEVKSLDSKKGTVTFSSVQTVPAYVSTAYDPTGHWDAQSPPPSGSSLGMYGKKPPTPDAINVDPGKTVKVAITFNDAVKVP
jgi:hypothetical protein